MTNRQLLSIICVALIAVAVAVFAANKDLILDIQQTTESQETAQNVNRETKATVTQPTTAATQPATSATAAPKPTFINPQFKAENITGAPNASAGTFTGYAPLALGNFAIADPSNTAGLSTATINHSFGVAKDGKPHHISVNSQAMFDNKGYNAVTYDNKSTDKVLYLTFDCGYENGYTFDVLDTLKAKNVSAAFFCTLDHIKAEPELITRMIKEGHIVGNHSDNHPNFSKISREKMAEEIKGCDDYLRQKFGYTSPYFRFPEGAYNESALQLVGSLGYKSVFWSLAYSDWDTSNQKGKDYAFDKVTSRLHPGAIILLHSVSADNAQALGDIIDYALSQGYVFKPLTQLPQKN